MGLKEQVYNFLYAKPNGCAPTQIGLGIGKNYSTASSSVNTPLKKLIEEGLVKKIKVDNKVRYYRKN